MQGYVVLADGRAFVGEGFGAEGLHEGELVFNTSMTGYQEMMTDPSYAGQILTLTYPMIGNYGTCDEDQEADRPWVEGLVVREYVDMPSNFRSSESLGSYLRRNGIPGVQGVDTRALVRHIREQGAMPAVIAVGDDLDIEDLRRRAAAVGSMEGRDLVADVSCAEPYDWNQGVWQIDGGFASPPSAQWKLAVYDYGIKRNMLRLLVQHGFAVRVFPADTPASEVLAGGFDAVFLSNGPGDPAAVSYAHEIIAQFVGKLPVFGICLGHQLACTALGAGTFKLKFGHRGGNQPVMDLVTRKVEITAQNHGFAVDTDSLPAGVRATHLNLNDQTLEGVELEGQSLFTVQYHPEASCGPRDSEYLFGRFVEVVREFAQRQADGKGH